jgi:hypothetical protein
MSFLYSCNEQATIQMHFLKDTFHLITRHISHQIEVNKVIIKTNRAKKKPCIMQWAGHLVNPTRSLMHSPIITRSRMNKAARRNTVAIATCESEIFHRKATVQRVAARVAHDPSRSSLPTCFFTCVVPELSSRL